MRDPILAATLVSVGAGALLGVGARRAQAPGGGVALGAMLLGMALRPTDPDIAFDAAWLALSASAAAVWPGPRGPAAMTLLLAAVAGAAAGWLVDGRGAALALAAGMVAFAISRLAAARGALVAVRVVAAWLMAVALLNGALAALPVTPGYVADHLE